MSDTALNLRFFSYSINAKFIIMLAMLDTQTIVTGFIVFFARICDVSIGTVRTITTVQGRTGIAFILAVFEITIWISVAGVVINQIRENPILIFFYALGYATGNVVGIITEKNLLLD
jgi:uncharacterized protein YebE (UPF0316 family)